MKLALFGLLLACAAYIALAIVDTSAWPRTVQEVNNGLMILFKAGPTTEALKYCELALSDQTRVCSLGNEGCCPFLESIRKGVA